VLLALADASSRDDRTGCWPSVATIARKANISERTVRRVIARLEADRHVIVHRGCGRAGATNSYTVVTGGHHPGQSVTPDRLTGVTPVTGEGGHPCHGTPDTTVSLDPPKNHQGTTTPRAADSAAVNHDPCQAAPPQPFAFTTGHFAERWIVTPVLLVALAWVGLTSSGSHGLSELPASAALREREAWPRRSREAQPAPTNPKRTAPLCSLRRTCGSDRGKRTKHWTSPSGAGWATSREVVYEMTTSRSISI